MCTKKVPRSGGGYSVTENTQSPKICLNFNFRGGGGYSVLQNRGYSVEFAPNFRGEEGGIL